MSRRRTLEEFEVVHPKTGHHLLVKAMDDGNFNIVILNPHEGVRPMGWGVAGLFSGGKTGTLLRLYQRAVEDDESAEADDDL